ncbi:MAG: acyltransferase [Bacteroidetes bacterium]|nr:MAG: acyltransferase [Bacteroidota bacterium]TAG90495.1 MAG: acyltransferase [Bacteroidota bacterium]
MNSKQFDYSLLKSVGENVFISANVEIRRPHLVSVGSHVAIDTGCYITTQANISDYTHIAPYTTIIGGSEALLEMEHFTTIAAGSRIICGSDGHLGEGLIGPTIPEPYKDEIYIASIKLQMFASIGTNVVVFPGITLAEGSVVGACSLVTKNTEPWTIYLGVPARPIKARKKEKMIEYAKQLGYLQ